MEKRERDTEKKENPTEPTLFEGAGGEVRDSAMKDSGNTKKSRAKSEKGSHGQGEKSSSKGKALLKTSPIRGKRIRRKLSGLAFERHFSKENQSPFDSVDYVKASSRIKDTDGSTVFEMKEIEVPATWSQLAIDILVSKYFRKAGVPKTGHEVSVRQVIGRVARTIRSFGQENGYFDSENAEVFEAELTTLLLHQKAAFNSPVWFNLGLWHEYRIEGSGGNYTWNAELKGISQTETAYQAPQCSACFIQSVDDDLMAIFDLAKNEARLFKYGSGTGSNFSRIRGVQEKLSGGGTSSGLMSFLEVFDKGAGATKSGGTTRRAAKMVCLDLDHPEIRDFVTWKSREEKKARILAEAGYGTDFNGEAYRTVSGQNSNNSVRIPDEFMRSVESDGEWATKARTTGKEIDRFRARELWDLIGKSAWECADPGVQFDTTINSWHTCKESGRINASNPCSEYMFLDDTACNLSSLNLVSFLREDGSFDIEGYRRAIRVMIVAQEILVDLSSYPTQSIAKNSHDYRPLGLGYANLGTLLMLKGIPYDSDEGRAWAGALTALLCGEAYRVSAEEADKLGTFEGYSKNRDSMLQVIQKHREASYEIDSTRVPMDLLRAAQDSWDQALEKGKKAGFRNSQVTVLAPTGTIGLLMDCDTTGVEPDFALVKFKKLAGGGYFKIVNQSVPSALGRLGYTVDQIEDILRYVLGSMNFGKAPHVNREFLKSRGLTDREVDRVQRSLPSVFELSSAFTRHALGDDVLDRVGVSQKDYEAPQFNFLTWAGLTHAQIDEANEIICGTMTVEGAPHLKEEHLGVFDCANKCGVRGERFIEPMGHVRMMAAVQPFLSGAISKTVNVPNETSQSEISRLYYESWKLGLKAVAVYRDGCKVSQPLSTKSDQSSSKESEKKSQESDVAKAVAQMTFAPVRRKLPSRRQGFTQEAAIRGHKVYLRTGEYEDGMLGEIFIDMHKEGAAYRSMMNCFAVAVSLGLQYGVPLREFVNKFTFTRFEPSGLVEGHPNIKMATSIVDYIFRVLGMEYLGQTDFLQVKPEPKALGSDTDIGGTGPKDPSSLIASGVPLEGSDPQMTMDLKSSGKSKDHLAEMMGDAPPCDECGHTTVRNGSCYRCMNCGNSIGCS